MVFFVVSGKSIMFTLKLTGAATTTKVTFKKKDGGEVVSEVTVAADAFDPLDEGGKTVQVAQYRFAAPTLAAEERELDVLMTHDKQGADAKPIPIKVYRDALKVKVTQTGPDGTVADCPGILVGIKVAPHADWMASRRLKDATPMQKREESGADGLATFTGLAYGGLSAEALSPGVLVEEVTKGGDTWTVKVKPQVVAKLISPTPLAAGAAPHQQWVNLDFERSTALNDRAAGPSYGSKVSVKVAGLVNNVATRNVRVFLGVLFSPKNSPRTGLPRPALETTATVPGALKLADKVTDDTGHAVFELELGVAGGDQVQIFAAGTPVTEQEHDSASALITWRKLDFRIFQFGGAAYEGTNPQVPPAARTKIEGELRKAFYDVSWSAPVRREYPNPANAKKVTGQLAADIGLSATGQYLIWTGQNAPHKGVEAYFGSVDYPPMVATLLVDKMWTSGRQMSWALKEAKSTAVQKDKDGVVKPDQVAKSVSDLRATVELVVPPGGKVLSSRLDGTSALLNWEEARTVGIRNLPAVPSYWAPQDDPDDKHPILAEHVKPVPGSKGKKISVEIPNDTPAAKKPASVFLRIATFAPGEVGSANGRRLSISCGSDPMLVAYTVLHEFGHSAKIVPKSPSTDQLSTEASYAHHYEFSGGHCNFGLSAKNVAIPSWTDPATTVRGSCCMFSPTVPKTDYSKVSEYCANCIKFMQASTF
jgi:hypothetical protein